MVSEEKLAATRDVIKQRSARVQNLRASVEKAERDNEAHYALTCDKLRELKELNQLDPILRQELQQLKHKLECKIAEASDQLAKEEREMEALHQQKEQLQAEVRPFIDTFLHVIS